MRILGIVAFFVLLTVPTSLFAQRTGSGTSGGGSSINTDFGSSYQGVANVSEQAARQGEFIGAGVPSGFVGVDEIYSGGGSSNASRAASTRRQTTTTRTAARPATTQRRTAMASNTARSNLLGSNNQSIRAVASIDFDVPASFSQAGLPAAGTVESGLKRIQGIQDSRVMFQSSQTGTTAVLTGTVSSDRERRVAQAYLLMEPGVNRVENLLEIRGSK